MQRSKVPFHAKGFAWLVVLGALISCSKEKESAESIQDAASNAPESALALVASLASDTENGPVGPSLLAACSLEAARSACSGNVMTVKWPNCTYAAAAGGTVTLSGGWQNLYSDGLACTNAKTQPLGDGESVTRTSSGFTITFPNKAYIKTDTAAHVAYDETQIPATGATVSNSSGTRTIVIDGMRRRLYGPRGGTWFDHSLTSTDITVTGSRAQGTRSIVSGELVVYHNVAEYKATNAFDNVKWSSAGCCYPTSGKISSTFEGSIEGTTRLEFGSQCGQATFTDTAGKAFTISLTQCE